VRFLAALATCSAFTVACCAEAPRQQLPDEVRSFLNEAAQFEVQRATEPLGSWSRIVEVVEGPEREPFVAALLAAVDARHDTDLELVAFLSPALRITAAHESATLELVLHSPPANRLEYVLEPNGIRGMVNVDDSALRALED